MQNWDALVHTMTAVGADLCPGNALAYTQNHHLNKLDLRWLHWGAASSWYNALLAYCQAASMGLSGL